MPKLPAQPNQSLISGLECLCGVVAHGEPVGSRELARMLGDEPTRVNRLLKTLGALGFVQQNANRLYQAGPGVHVLAAIGLRGSKLLSRALPELEQLERETGHPAALGVLWRDDVCYLYHGGAGKLAAGIAAHGLHPVACSSIGKAILSRTEKSSWPKSVGRLASELMEARKQGYALDDSAKPGSLAVVVGNPAIAGLALIKTAQAPIKPTRDILQALNQAAERISLALLK